MRLIILKSTHHQLYKKNHECGAINDFYKDNFSLYLIQSYSNYRKTLGKISLMNIFSMMRKISRTNFELKFKSSAGENVHIFERPALFLDSDEQKRLKDEIYTFSLKCTPNNQILDYGIFKDSDDGKFLEKCILTTVRDKKNEKLIAFNCLPLLDVTLKNKPIYFVHMGLVMIDPDNRSKGLVWILYGLTVVIMFCRHRLKPIWISNVTQVPAIVGLFSEGFDSVYPDPLKDSRRTFDHISLVRQIMLNHRHMFGVGHEAEFDEKSFIIKNAYTGGSNNLLKSWDEVAKHRNDRVNNFCSERLDYNRGDDFIQIAKLDFFNLQRYIIRVVPIKSLAMILNNIILVILQSILLPIYYWFKSDTSTMDLKPGR